MAALVQARLLIHVMSHVRNNTHGSFSTISGITLHDAWCKPRARQRQTRHNLYHTPTPTPTHTNCRTCRLPRLPRPGGAGPYLAGWPASTLSPPCAMV